MKEEIDYKNKFLKLNSESIELFNELHSNYESLRKDHESLKVQNIDLIKKKTESTELFNELQSDYESLRKDHESLKVQNIDLINKKVELTLGVNAKFGIINLAKLNGEAVFDAMNHFNKLCPYCKTDLYGGHLRNNYEIDHFYPIAKGGQDVPWNLLPICRNCNRKKRDILPFKYLDEKTFNECNKYLESVMFKITNNHEDRLQRDEIIRNLLLNLSSNKHNTDKFVNELYMLFNIPVNYNKNELLDFTEIKNEILINKEHLFGSNSGSYTTEKKVADLLFNNKPTQEQKKVLKAVMRVLFNDCRISSNTSYYSVRECKEKLKRMEQLSSPTDNVENNSSDK